MLNNIRDIGVDISINNILYGNSDFAYDVNCSLFATVHRYKYRVRRHRGIVKLFAFRKL
jgi:uncharacterized protein with PhoU and TrkA domain